MNDGPEWFAAKKVGYGAGRPIAWQGWALLLGFIAFSAGFGILFGDQPLIFFPVFGLATFLFMVIAARTTRGGWKWRGPGSRD